MTIGIAATGANAGTAIRDALAMAEHIGTGDIGGFVAVAAITSLGCLIRCETQRGGIAAALRAAERQGDVADLLSAPLAALISSGPDRPTPLSRFLPADPAFGIVTGHRRPDFTVPDGRPINEVALDLLRERHGVKEALAAALEGALEIDAGLLAVVPGEIAAGNSARVARRTDCGLAIRRPDKGPAVGVIHNSIAPVHGLAELVAGLACEVLCAGQQREASLRLVPGTPIVVGPQDEVDVDDQGIIRRIASANPHLIGARRWTSSAVYLGSQVRRDGQLLGRTVQECQAMVDGDQVVGVAPPGLINWMKELVP